MQALIYSLLLSILTLDYLDKVLEILPAHLELIPEVLSIIATVIIIGQLSLTRTFNLGIKYLILFTLFGVHIVNGTLINNTPTLAIVVGIRTYFKFIPFFLLPLVYRFDELQIQKQLKFLLILCLFQLPVALWQKFIYASNASGDWVRGTLTSSSFLTILQICAITVVMSFFLKGKISTKVLIILMLLLFIPTTINETKGTIVLLPIALAVPLWISRKEGRNDKPVLPILIMAGVMFGGFVTVYDVFWGDRYEKYGGSVIDFFTSDRLIRYVAPRTSGMVEEEKEGGPTGRVDKLMTPFQMLSKDPVQLFVGVGIGNITPFPIKSLSQAEYVEHYATAGMAVGTIQWEFGLIGVIFTFVFISFVLLDSRYLSKRSDFYGALGMGWFGITIIIMLSMVYKNIISSNAIMYMFWYFSGIVIAKRHELMKESSMKFHESKRFVTALNHQIPQKHRWPVRPAK